MSKMILYHYTNADGLRGIIESKSIWASDCRFLNDATEFNYGLSIFDEIFASYAPTSLPPELADIIRNFRKASLGVCVLVASFCQDPDLLSQWRGYNGAAGYALGIDADWLGQNSDEQGFLLVPTCYDQRAVVNQIKLLETRFDKQAGSRTPQELVQEWWAKMLQTVMVLKNEHFKEEREYRLVKATHGWPSGICTRPTPRGLIPYLPVKLNAKVINNPRYHPRNCGFERIIVGPALDDQQRVAVDALLASQHMRFEITKSAIPYVPNR
jgi:hypothetical protein